MRNFSGSSPPCSWWAAVLVLRRAVLARREVVRVAALATVALRLARRTVLARSALATLAVSEEVRVSHLVS